MLSMSCLIDSLDLKEVNANGLSRHVKKHSRHGKKKGNNHNKHYENEQHSLQGKSGKVRAIILLLSPMGIS